MKFIKKTTFHWLLLTFPLWLQPLLEWSVKLPFAVQFRGEQDVIAVGELVRPLVSVHRLVLLLPDMYRLLDPSVHSVEARCSWADSTSEFSGWHRKHQIHNWTRARRADALPRHPHCAEDRWTCETTGIQKEDTLTSTCISVLTIRCSIS